MKDQVARVWLYKTDSLAVLLQKRSPFIRNAGKYDASAGGHLDGEETPEDAVVRECQEEIGIKLKGIYSGDRLANVMREPPAEMPEVLFPLKESLLKCPADFSLQEEPKKQKEEA